MNEVDKVPMVSVIIPVFNKASTILRAIESVVRQSYPDFELVIVDDGSTDSSPEILESIGDPRVRVVRQANAGPGAARNHGASLAVGRYLAFLDADDEWRSTFLERGVKMLMDHPESSAFVCGYDAQDFRTERPNKLVALGKARCCSRLDTRLSGEVMKAHVDAMHSSCIIVTHAAFDSAGGYFTRDRCRYGEDSFLWLKVLLNGNVCWDPAELAIFHVEDSALGFAVTERTSARPVSLYADELRECVPSEMRESLERVIDTYSNADLSNLRRSGSFLECRSLRALRGSKSIKADLGDYFRYVAHKMKSRLS